MRIRLSNKKRNVHELRQPRQKSVDEKTVKYKTDLIKSSPANCLFTVSDVRGHVEELKSILQKGEEPSLVIMSYEAQLRTLEKKVIRARVRRYVNYIKEYPRTSSFELRLAKEYLQRAEKVGLDLSIYMHQLPALERLVRNAKSKEKS